jgi:hypothetical protein
MGISHDFSNHLGLSENGVYLKIIMSSGKMAIIQLGIGGIPFSDTRWM